MLIRLTLLVAGIAFPASHALATGDLATTTRAEPRCVEFNDGCSVCLLEDGAAQCSTTGIACVPTGWKCAAQASPAPAIGSSNLPGDASER